LTTYSSSQLPPARDDGPNGAAEAPALQLGQTLRKYWVTALATAVAVVVATVFFTLGQKRIYQAEATVMFDPHPPSPLGKRVEAVVDMGAGTFWNNQEYYETQYNIIKSRRVALAVVEDLGLQNDPAFLQNLPEGQQPTKAEPAGPELAAETLRGRLKVDPVKDSRMATVKLRDANPKRAQRILGALVETYVQQNLDTAMASTSSATDWLRGQLDSLKNDLESSEMALHQYKKKKDILSLAFDDKSSMLAGQMKDINAELTRVRALQQEAMARRNVLAGAPGGDPTLIQDNELLHSAQMIGLRSRYQEAVRERDGLLGSGKGPHHPDVAAAERRVKSAKKAILKEIANIKRAAGGEVAKLARQAGGLQGMLEAAKQQAHELGLLEIEYNRLNRSKENTEKLYSLVLERTKEADLSQMLRVNNITIVDKPLVPMVAVSPRVPLNLAVGVMLALLFGVGAAFGRNLMDRTVRIPEDVERELGVTFLGLLPEQGKAGSRGGYYGYGARHRRHRGKRVQDGRPELVVHEDPTSSIAEAARAIRTNLMFMAPDTPYKTLLVTSAGPSEGKTTVACCVAVAMAQAGQRVLLVDCDLRRPRVHRIFPHDDDAGVTTVLLQDNLAEAIVETEVPQLSVLTSGPVPPNPAELFHTERFKKLLHEAAAHFDRVVIDSAPVVAVTDPTILSTLVDGTVLVVRANKTRKELARHALGSLQAVGGKLAGVVLNAVDVTRSEYKYSYYYYHRGGYYGSPPASSRDVPAPPEQADARA